MDLYVIFRRSGWGSQAELAAADARSNAEADKRNDTVRKIRSYLLEEPDGRLGTLCLYQATGPEALLEHAEAADLPCDEAVRISAIDIHRPDPELSAI
ncbi:Protein of unknown function [Haloechinothrix alba]|uniref:DUF4242 domain-containing protein n=1 Tax=Haloechinothrix alba TaxID=664784 RepID=A0A238XM26_9PSEU|nr:nickel-binding protein [Haloechinothrix alba]SNR59732.1 Protein of unknown function [Haloechinothrix alba]